MKIAKFLCSFLVAACACFCVTPALAESKTVTLVYQMEHRTDAAYTVNDPYSGPYGGSGSPTVTLNEDGTAQGGLPTPSAITGWEFIGWYDKPVYTMWWNAVGGVTPDKESFMTQLNKKEPPTFFRDNTTNIRGSVATYDADSYFNTRLVGVANGGQKVDNNTNLTNVDKLYAAYKPVSYEVLYYSNGFEGYGGGLHAYSDYYTIKNMGQPYASSKYRFDGWFEVVDGKGTDTKYDPSKPVTASKKVYAKWHTDDGQQSQSFSEYGHSTPVSISIGVGSTPRIDPKQGNITVSVSLQSAPGDPNPNRADYSKVQWSCDSGLVKITPSSDKTTCTITALGNPGKVTIKATYDNLTATQEITLAHSFSGNAKVEVYPSCEGKGKGYRLCSVCGAREEITWAADGHRFTYHRENATCTKPGCVDRYCVVCGKHEHETTQPALSHNYASKQIRSCTGLTTIETCSRCGNQITTTDSTAGSHHWASTKTVDKAATCKTEGTKSLHCLDCDVTTQQETIPILTTHTLGSYVKVKDATANEKGLEEATCSVCGLKESRDIPKLEDKGIVTATPDSGSSTTPTTPGGSSTTPTTPGGSSTTPTTPGGSSSGSTGSGSTTTPGSGGGGSSSVPSLTPGDHEQIPPVTDDQEQVTPPEDNTTPPEDNSSNNDTTTTTPPAGNDNDNTPVPGTLYRLYNESNGAHLLTKDLNEKNTLVKLGWKYEGTAGVTSDKGIPVYRLYNPSLDEHMFTSDVNEYNTLGRIGWKQEGEAWKADGTKPMYRLYNPNVTNGPNHHYTTDVNEYNVLGKIGWNQEGIAWYLQ